MSGPARRFVALYALAFAFSLSVAHAAESSGADWPSFQGPLGNGGSPETGLLREWPKAGPKVLWRAKIKPGWSSPVVVGDDVYLCASEELRGENESITCFSAATGDVRWKETYEVGPYWAKNIGWARGGFRATPAVAGDRLYTLGSIGHLRCQDRRTGKLVWEKNLWDELNPSGEKGYVFSPVVEDGKLLLWYGDGVSSAKRGPDVDRERDEFEVVCRALDAATGEERWTFREPHRRPARTGEGQTPTIATFGGDKCLLVTANCQLKALRIADGKEVWKYDCIKSEARGTTIPSPLLVGDVVLNLPDGDAAHAIRVDRVRLDREPTIDWKKDLSTYCAIHQLRHHQGYLYGFTGVIRGDDEKIASESKLNLSCLDLATGKVAWSEPGFQVGVALTTADGLLFVRRYQTLLLVEATPDGYRQLGQVRTHAVWKPTLNLLDMVQPVLSRGRLFVRTPEELICYQVARE